MGSGLTDWAYVLLVALGVLILGAFVGMHLFRSRILRRNRLSGPEADEPRCSKCGYSLRGLRFPRCPECGTLRGFETGLEQLDLTEEERSRIEQHTRQR